MLALFNVQMEMAENNKDPFPPFTPTITFINVVSTITHILDLAVGRSHTHKGQVFKESCTYELKHHLNATSKQQATFSLTYIN
jgi:hypothetical protein